MKLLSNLIATMLLATLAACSSTSTTQSRMGNVDCEALKNMDHSQMDQSTMTPEMHALHQQCGIKMNMPVGNDSHHGHH